MDDDKEALVYTKKDKSVRNINYVLTLVVFIIILVIGVAALGALNLRETMKVLRYSEQENDGKILVPCKVLVIGAGIGGLYTAYKLAITREDLRNFICLIEKESYLGGRIHDVGSDGSEEGDQLFGTGALRVTKQHPNMMVLAHRFNLQLQPVQSEVELLRVRGKNYRKDYMNHSLSQVNQLCNERYINLTCGTPAMDADDTFIDKLVRAYNAIKDNQTALAQYADMHTFAMSVLGDEAARLIAESSRLNIFLERASIESFMDFLIDEPTGSSELSFRQYPIGGMSAFIRGLKADALRYGVRIYTDEITSLNSLLESSSLYEAWSRRYKYVGTDLMIAVPAQQLLNIEGNIVESIIVQDQFKLITPQKVVTVAAWWNQRWWEHMPMTFSRVVSRQVCFNVMELPETQYIQNQNVIRVVYDEWNCVQSWERLILLKDESLLIDEVMRGLNFLFPNSSIPRPKKVYGQIWEDGWHFNLGRNKDVEQWAADPLPGQSVALIGSAYNLKWSVWSEGALVSAMNALVKHFDFHFDKCPCNMTVTEECYFDGICPPVTASLSTPRKYRFNW